MVLAGEQADSAIYDDQPEARSAGLPAEERSHGRVFRAIAASSKQGLEWRNGRAPGRSPPGKRRQRPARGGASASTMASFRTSA